MVDMMGKEKDNTQKIKKYFIIILALFCVTIATRLAWKLYNHYTVPENTEPLIFLSGNEIKLYYLQNREFIEKPAKIIEGHASFECALNRENKEEILLVFYENDIGIMKYNYVTTEMQPKGKYSELLDYSGEIEELRFVPGSNNISFVLEEKIWVYNSEEKCYQIVYDYSGINHRLGYPYEWKNAKEIYLLHSGNIVLYNIETKQTETIVEDVGSVYFQMSDDQKYLVRQDQIRESNREIYVLDMDSGEQWRIHTAKSTYKIDMVFSEDNNYIFLRDRPEDLYLGKVYCYLYDINRHKKYRLDTDTEKEMYKYGLVGW